MNPENHNEKKASAHTDENTLENFENTFEHLKAGYANAQEIIKFIDTKTSFLTGASALVIGFVMEALKQYIVQVPPNIKHDFDSHPYLVCVLMVLGELSLLAGGICIWCSVLSLIARPPTKKLKRNCTILFPFYSGKPSERDYCAKVSQGLTDKEILKEYEAQIWNVGLILQKKLFRHRWAGKMFLIQLIILTVGGIMILACI